MPGVPSPCSATSSGAVSIPGNYNYSTEDYYYENITATPATYMYELDSYGVSCISLGIPLKNRFSSPKSLPQGKINGLKPLSFRPQNNSSEFEQNVHEQQSWNGLSWDLFFQFAQKLREIPCFPN